MKSSHKWDSPYQSGSMSSESNGGPGRSDCEGDSCLVVEVEEESNPEVAGLATVQSDRL